MAVDGTYEIELDTPMGKQQVKLTLATKGNSLSGTMEGPFGKQEFSGGTVSGDEVAWKLAVSGPMGNMELACKGKISGKTCSGEVKAGDFGTSQFKGKRVEK